MMSDQIVNKVAESGLITIDPANYYPQGETKVFDLKDHLFMGLILKEKDYREALKNKDWEEYKNKNVAITCTVDAIIPVWAYMLAASYLQPIAANVVMGDEKELHRQLFLENITSIDFENLRDQRIVIKGCGDLPIGDYVYLELTKRLRPIAKSIMYGEPCSTVPVFKRSQKSESPEVRK